jgi:hypothetical protein
MSAIPKGKFTCRYLDGNNQAMPDNVELQNRLKRIRDELCGGNAAELARRIKKDGTYVNRLFYPAGKKGAKGIGLEIMAACNDAFNLPPGYWDGKATREYAEPAPLTPEALAIARWFDKLTDPADRAVAETACMGAILRLLQGLGPPPSGEPTPSAGGETPSAPGRTAAPPAPPTPSSSQTGPERPPEPRER